MSATHLVNLLDGKLHRLFVGEIRSGRQLIEDVPGTGKTVMAKAIARSLGLPVQLEIPEVPAECHELSP